MGKATAKKLDSSTAAVWRHIDELVPWEQNPRANEAAVPKVKASLLRFGFAAPVVNWQSKNRLVAGHTRLLAFREILKDDPNYTFEGSPGAGFVPVREHEFRSEAEALAYAIADNRLAYEADWDYGKLVPLLDSLKNDADKDLLALTGFDFPELEALTRSQWGADFAGLTAGTQFKPTGGKPAESQRPPADPNFLSILFSKGDWEKVQKATSTEGQPPEETVNALVRMCDAGSGP